MHSFYSSQKKFTCKSAEMQLQSTDDDLLVYLQKMAQSAQELGSHQITKVSQAPSPLEFMRWMHASKPALIDSNLDSMRHYF